MDKYKARRVDDNEWVYGSLVLFEPLETYIMPEWSNADPYTNSMLIRTIYEVDPKTVSRSIGETDKDGVEVYLGDEVEWFGRIRVVVWSKAHCGVLMQGLPYYRDGDSVDIPEGTTLDNLDAAKLKVIRVVGHVSDREDVSTADTDDSTGVGGCQSLET